MAEERWNLLRRCKHHAHPGGIHCSAEVHVRAILVKIRSKNEKNPEKGT